MRPQTVAPRLVEIISPRGQAPGIAAVESLLGSVGFQETFSLEMAATESARWFLARAGNEQHLDDFESQLRASYPQSDLRHLDTAAFPSLDPARLGHGEQVAACALGLRGPAYLPLLTFEDGHAYGSRASEADPIVGILGALGAVPDGWRALSQLVLWPAPLDWNKGYQRLALQHPLEAERVSSSGDTSLAPVFILGGAMMLGALGFQAYHWYQAGDWMQLGQLAGATVLGGSGMIGLAVRLGRKPLYDPRLVQQKIAFPAYVAQLRLAVFAPADVPARQVHSRLERIAAAYGQYGLAFGNSLVPRRIKVRDAQLSEVLIRRGWPTALLNIREVAGLWHLPSGSTEVPFLERTTALRHLPLPVTVARGCRIGTSLHQGRGVPISTSDTLLHRNLLMVAKTRRGKSSLMLRFARYLMDTRSANGRRQTVVLVDPHEDLARAALGSVPENRRNDVVYLNVSDQERPFGLNLLDSALFTDRDKMVEDTLAIFEREFQGYWGPRMGNAFRWALLTLIEANRTLCATDPDGRARQFTVLDVPALFDVPPFRRALLPLIQDPEVRAWWPLHFETMDRHQQSEIPNPVITKVQRFTASRLARSIVGQAESTVDPASWLRDGKIVIVNTARGTVGENTSALLGAALLNLIALQVAESSALDPTDRPQVTVLVDEFHTMPGANYEGILGELAKYGANLVLATQSLSRLDFIDRTQQRELRATVFSNVDGLFAFNTSADDARYLVRELGEEIEEQDLVSLGEYQCYARWRAEDGERLPTFSLRLDPPSKSDPKLAAELAAESAARCRPMAEVEAARRAAQARIAGYLERTHEGSGTTKGGGEGESKKRVRTRNGPGRPRPTDPHQGTFAEVDDPSPQEQDERDETEPDDRSEQVA